MIILLPASLSSLLWKKQKTSHSLKTKKFALKPNSQANQLSNPQKRDTPFADSNLTPKSSFKPWNSSDSYYDTTLQASSSNTSDQAARWNKSQLISWTSHQSNPSIHFISHPNIHSLFEQTTNESIITWSFLCSRDPPCFYLLL